MLAFATLFTIVIMLAPGLVQAVGNTFTSAGRMNSITLKNFNQSDPDHPTIRIGDEWLLDRDGGEGKKLEVVFRIAEMAANKGQWERKGADNWEVIPAGKKAEFTLQLGKGMGTRTVSSISQLKQEKG
jgi:hypothetical protein